MTRNVWLVQEDEGTKEAKNHQLLTEDIDSILARAEVLTPTCLLIQDCPFFEETQACICTRDFHAPVNSADTTKQC